MDASYFQTLLRSRIQDAEVFVTATNKSSVLVIQQFPVPSDQTALVPHVRESVSNVLAFVELGNVDILGRCLELADGVFDVILMDADLKLPQSESLIRFAATAVRKSQLFYFNYNSVWAAAGIGIVQVIERGMFGKKVLLTGDGMLTTHLALNLIQAGSCIYRFAGVSRDMLLTNTFAFQQVNESIKRVDDGFDYSSLDLVIGGAVKEESLSHHICRQLRDGVRLYDIGIGNFPEGVVSTAREKGCEIYRLDNRVGMSSLVLGQLEAEYLVKNCMGKVHIKSTEIVAGGIMGRNGAIIVDNIKDPAYIIGVADGKGRVKYQPETDQERKDHDFVQRLIKKW